MTIALLSRIFDFIFSSVVIVILILVNMLVVLIMLVNMLIAQLSTAYENAQKNGEIQFSIDQAWMTTKLESSHFKVHF